MAVDHSTGRRPQLDGRGMRIALVCGRFNDRITDLLVAGARAALTEAGVAEDAVRELWVPGAFELPVTARALALSGQVDAVVCLGVVIRGETSHYEHVAEGCALGIQQVQLDTGVPVMFGVLTTENVEQAVERADPSRDDKGAEVARGAVEMVQLLRSIERG